MFSFTARPGNLLLAIGIITALLWVNTFIARRLVATGLLATTFLVVFPWPVISAVVGGQ
jgi:hypothetical protein